MKRFTLVGCLLFLSGILTAVFIGISMTAVYIFAGIFFISFCLALWVIFDNNSKRKHTPEKLRQLGFKQEVQVLNSQILSFSTDNGKPDRYFVFVVNGQILSFRLIEMKEVAITEEQRIFYNDQYAIVYDLVGFGETLQLFRK